MSITVAPTPVPHHRGYGAAYAAVQGLWRSLAAELGPHGIRLVNLRSAGSPDAPDIKQTLVAQAVVIMASDRASAMTGAWPTSRPAALEVAETTASSTARAGNWP